MHLPSSAVAFPSQALHLFSVPPERSGHGDRALGDLCYLRPSRSQALNELLLRLHRPQNSGKYSPVAFPEDLWYSCPRYPRNALVEFPRLDEKQDYLCSFEKRNTDLPYRCPAASHYCKKSKGQEVEKETQTFVLLLME